MEHLSVVALYLRDVFQSFVYKPRRAENFDGRPIDGRVVKKGTEALGNKGIIFERHFDIFPVVLLCRLGS